MTIRVCLLLLQLLLMCASPDRVVDALLCYQKKIPNEFPWPGPDECSTDSSTDGICFTVHVKDVIKESGCFNLNVGMHRALCSGDRNSETYNMRCCTTDNCNQEWFTEDFPFPTSDPRLTTIVPQVPDSTSEDALITPFTSGSGDGDNSSGADIQENTAHVTRDNIQATTPHAHVPTTATPFSLGGTPHTAGIEPSSGPEPYVYYPWIISVVVSASVILIVLTLMVVIAMVMHFRWTKPGTLSEESSESSEAGLRPSRTKLKLVAPSALSAGPNTCWDLDGV